MDKYLDNSITNPKFLFHGSPKKLEVIEQRQAYDSNGTKENEDFAVFYDIIIYYCKCLCI